MYNRVKTAADIENLRISGKILASTLHLLQQKLEPGMTTKELDTIAEAELKSAGAIGPSKGHDGFPAVLCVSVNNEVVHGIPGPRRIEAGDIVGLDFVVGYNGMITDAAITVPVREVAPKVQRLLAATREALYEGIGAVHAGARIGDISNAVEKRLKRDRLGIIEELAGHGVGDELHEDPIILNYGKAGRGPKLETGMTIAIEPMATLGSKHIYVADDNWTIVTSDGSWGAQFEHTVLVTDDGAEILTQL
jgi:methionyl aminopeptidase